MTDPAIRRYVTFPQQEMQLQRMQGREQMTALHVITAAVFRVFSIFQYCLCCALATSSRFMKLPVNDDSEKRYARIQHMNKQNEEAQDHF